MPFRNSAVALLVGVFFAVACLPADTRPEPAKIVVNVELHSALRMAEQDPASITFRTDDGWMIELNRVLVSMGHLSLDGDDCNAYADAFYTRVLDLSQPEPQRLGQIWGLNDCRLHFAVRRPEESAVFGLTLDLKLRPLHGKAPALRKFLQLRPSTPHGLPPDLS